MTDTEITVNHPDRPLRFLHAADLHLGAPLKSLGNLLGDDARTAELRQLADRSFDSLVDTAIAEEVHFVVLAGDVYDGADREVKAQLRFLAGLERLDHAGIPVFVAHGNHDPLTAEVRHAGRLPGNVVVFEPGTPQTYRMRVDGRSVAVTGVSFSDPSEEANLVERIGAAAVSADLHVAVVHANVAGVPGHNNYAGCTAADLANPSVHYWALGHIHLQTVTSMGGGRWWVYPGNLQGRSTKAAECGEKGAVVVEADILGFAEPRPVACDHVRFERIDIDATGMELTADVLAAIRTEATAKAAAHGGRPVLARVGVTGATAAHTELQQLDLDTVRSALGNSSGVEVLKLRVDTRPAVDLAKLRDGDDVVGHTLLDLDRLRAAPDGLDAALEPLATAGTVGADAVVRVREQLRLGQLDPATLLDRVEAALVGALDSGTTEVSG